ncbi:VCBS repeat-containing protein [Pedobacter riviphilus]|uniref:VCBS repeat-containing protein n=1 Tax=Pedobacter riviphilus TaxID=2766984 RepID=A0ABX6TBL9_9SPHI|nr:FG-GAP-like repeat-containing protein [Pedobacter riviphilus]QNR82889.1 VCBS repeat-containing protein [Pedobacter riviphilus]
MITRTGNSNSIDGFSQPVLFSAEDHLQLDGQRLFAVVGDEGLLGSRYFTENNSFKRATIEKNTGVNTINGIRLIKVETKDGLEYYYGDIQNLRSMAGMSKLEEENTKGIVYTKTLINENVPLIWLVTLIRDKNNNWIYFKYNLENNYYSPDEIYYGGNDQSATGKVKFNYDWGKRLFGQSNPVNWSRTQYLRGETITINKPLASIISYYKPQQSTSEKLLKEYNFDYILDPVSNRLLLNRVYQSTIGYLDKNNKTSYGKKMSDASNAILFDWSKAKTEHRLSSKAPFKEDITLEEDYKVAIADFNGDGFPDKLMHKNHGNKLTYFLSLNDRKGNFTHFTHVDTVLTTIDAKAKSFTGDFNADGLNDLVYLSKENDKFCIYTYYSSTGGSNGNFKLKESISRNIASLPALEFKNFCFGVGDLNADGYSDILLYYIDKKQINYQSFFYSPSAIKAGTRRVYSKGNIPDENYNSQATDLNGDGITDLLYTWTNKDGWYIKSFMFANSKDLGFIQSEENKADQVVFNPGVDIKFPDGMSYDDIMKKIAAGELNQSQLDSLIEKGTNQTIAEGDYSKLGNLMYADINKDGNIDILISNSDQDGWAVYVALGKGDGTFTFRNKSVLTNSKKFAYNHKSSFGDFNGDGNPDLILQKTDEKGWFQLIAYGNGQGQFKLSKADGDFELLLAKNFSYSQRYITDYVMPYCASQLYRLERIWDDGRIKKIVDCAGMSQHECLLRNIRQIFPEETGFYPQRVSRPYQAPMSDILKNFIPQKLNIENNIKRIIESSYWGDSITTTASGWFCGNQSYKYYTKFTYGDYWQPYVADLNADGISDLMLAYPRQVPSDSALGLPKNELEDRLFAFVAINETIKNGYISLITHSNQSKISLEYASSTIEKKNPFTSTALSYPYIPCHAPIYTVSRVGVTNGLSSKSLNYTSYNYYNAVVSLNGRGFLGFEHKQVINENNGNRTDQTSLVDSSLLKLGIMPIKSIKTYVHGALGQVSDESMRYETTFHLDNKNVYSLFNIKKTSATFDLLGIPTSFSDIESKYDRWGNILSSQIKKGQGLSEITQSLRNVYYDSVEDGWIDEDKWLLGRLKSSEITTQRGEQKTVRTSIFFYHNETGQLIKEISDADDPVSPLSLTKTYSYNKSGSILESKIFPTNNPDPAMIKTISTVYNKDNRFVESTIDAMGYLSTKLTDPISGLVVESVLADKGCRTTTTADEFGRFQKVLLPEGIENRKEMRICTNCSIYGNASYFSVETSSISDHSIPVINFFDNTGKVVFKVNLDYRFKKVFTSYHYDAEGNLTRSSSPYFEGEKTNYTTFRYDALNRKILTLLPDNTTIKNEYIGLTSQIINQKGQRSTSIKNILGELEKSADDNGFTISYAYDNFGRVRTITDKNGLAYRMEYDLNGNRTQYISPNFSKPESAVYDAYGRRIKTTDPKGYEKAFSYDKLDRLTGIKADRPGYNRHEFSYTYIRQDEALEGKGRLKSISSNSDDHPLDETFTYNSSGQMLTHSYQIRKGSWLYEPHSSSKSKNTLIYEYRYIRGQLSSLIYPNTGMKNDNSKFVLDYSYENGTLVRASSKTAGRTIEFWKLLDKNAIGTTTAYQLGDSIRSVQEFSPELNSLKSIQYTRNAQVIAGMKYSYDEIGNLVFRQSSKDSLLADSIYYDKLNRVIAVKTGIYGTTVKYEDDGDIREKQYGADYKLEYAYQVGSNRFKEVKLTNISNGTVRKDPIDYDAAGNIQEAFFVYLFGGSRTDIVYNQFNLPYSISDTRFHYAYDETKCALYNSSSGSGSLFLGGLSEYNYKLNMAEQLRYQKINIQIEGKTVASFYSHSGTAEYFLKDALQSVIAVTDEKGKILKEFAYDIWGLRRDPLTWKYDWNALKNMETGTKEKGYLNNIALDGYGLVDMAARLYDPISGRFTGVDPITNNRYANTQFFNGYLYGYNNPTVYIDKNGKFGFLVAVIVGAYLGASAAGGSLLPWQWNENWWKGALVGGISVAGGYLAAPAIYTAGATVTPGMIVASGAAAGFAGSFTSTLVNGGTFGQAFENGLKGGIVGGVSACFTFGIGEAFGNNPEFLKGNYFAKASLHGLNQGIATEAMGGSFEHGFLAGSFTSAATPVTQLPGVTNEQRILLSGLVGGTASALGGGKFANGAVSGAMVQIFNENQTHPSDAKDGSFEFCTDDKSICIEGGVSLGNFANASLEGDLGVGVYMGVGGGVSHNLITHETTVSAGYGWDIKTVGGASMGINMGSKNGFFGSAGAFGANYEVSVNFNFSNIANTMARNLAEFNRQFENWVLSRQNFRAISY